MALPTKSLEYDGTTAAWRRAAIEKDAGLVFDVVAKAKELRQAIEALQKGANLAELRSLCRLALDQMAPFPEWIDAAWSLHQRAAENTSIEDQKGG